MEEELKSLKDSVTSYKSANTKQRAIIEELKNELSTKNAELAEFDIVIKHQQEKIDSLVEELDAMTKARDAIFKDYTTIQEVNRDLKASLDSNVAENKDASHAIEVLQKEVDKARDARDSAMQELIESRRPWWKKIF